MNFAVQLDYRTELGAARDQGARPTCVAHASTTAHEHARGSRLPLSPEYLHYFASPNDGSEDGVDFPEVSRALFDPGQPAETDCPYRTNDPPPEWTPPSSLSLYRRRSTSGAPNPDGVEALLNAGRLPVLGIATTSAFYDPTRRGSFPTPAPLSGFTPLWPSVSEPPPRPVVSSSGTVGEPNGRTPVTRGSMTHLFSGTCKTCWC